MTAPDDDEDDARTPEAKRAEQIAELQDDLAHSIGQRDRLRAPPSFREVWTYAWERLGTQPWPWAGLLSIGVAAALPILLDWPPLAAIPIALAGSFLIVAAAFLRERSAGERCSAAWRTRQALEFDAEIGDIRNELFRLGVRESDMPRPPPGPGGKQS